MKKSKKLRRQELLSLPIQHVDFTMIDARPIMDARKGMRFVAGDTARALELYGQMLKNRECTVIMTIAGSAGAAGCLQIPTQMVRNNMVDAIVCTGAHIVDMTFFEALGFSHYQGSPSADDDDLRRLMIDRIYDTFIDENELRVCDETIYKIANSLPPRAYSSREFIKEMGRYLLEEKPAAKDSLVLAAYECDVPIFVPAFSDCSAGFGLTKHQVKRPDKHLTIDPVKDFRELTEIVVKAGLGGGSTGLFMIGGGSPKNFAQDTVVCAEMLGHKVSMHKYAVQITVADVRDGACSSSTLKEANSWGKVEQSGEQMVFAEATTVWPEIMSAAYHSGWHQGRTNKNFSEWLDRGGLSADR